MLATGLWARSPVPSRASSNTPTTQAPAPGTPVGSNKPLPKLNKQTTSPCTLTKKELKREQRHERKHRNSPKNINDAEPGLVPLNCAGPKAEKGFDPHRVVGVGSDMIKIRPGSIEDVSAVGKRNIGGRGLGNWYSVQDEIKMGKQYAEQVDKSSDLLKDPVVDEYINRIGQNIVRNSDCKVPFTIKVIDSDQINAFALPGGFFYVNTGLIMAADDEAELAGVMAHETAHVCAHHAVREMTREHYAQLGMIPLMILTPYTWTGYGIYEGTQLALPVVFLKFSRDFEAQADYLGVQYMYRAGYDPQAMIDMFEKIEALQKRKPGLVAKLFDNHPETPSRILHTQEEIAEILPPRDEYLETTSEFNKVKARLARIENKRRLNQHHHYKPSLRRASNTGHNGSGTDATYHPTLHRRNDN